MTFRSEFGIHEVPQRPEPLQAATPQGETFRQMQPDPKHSSSAEIRMAYQLFQSHSLARKVFLDQTLGSKNGGDCPLVGENGNIPRPQRDVKDFRHTFWITAAHGWI